MGASPQQKAMEAAKESVERAVGRQEMLLANIKRGRKKYEQKAKTQLGKLEEASGTKLPDYISAVKGQFGPIDTIQDTQNKYMEMMQNFQPNLIGSQSEQNLMGSLRQSAQDYAQGISGVAGDVSGRLYRTLDEPMKQFEQLAGSSATNLFLDPIAIRLATNPITKRSDVEPMLRSLTNYNI